MTRDQAKAIGKTIFWAAKQYREVEAALAELREAVAWYFECTEFYDYDRKHGIVVGRAYGEMFNTIVKADIELRRLVEDKDGKMV